MRVHLVDGTYELFRHFFGAPPHRNAEGDEVAATRGVLSSVLQLLEEGATHIGVATDHVIESFRNDMWPGYKTGDGIDPDLKSQFWPLEDALVALGVFVWPMVDVEADDALASGAAVADEDTQVDQVVICTPDKDLGQCVRGQRVVQLDRRQNRLIDEAGVVAKFGVPPASIPDYLALVGDSADGFPGLAGWGAKSAATVLARWHHVEEIPPDAADGMSPCGAQRSWRAPCATASTTRCCSRTWRRCASTARCSRKWASCAGAGRRGIFPMCAGASMPMGSCRAPTPWPSRGRADRRSDRRPGPVNPLRALRLPAPRR